MLQLLAIVAFSLAWLIPNHYPPWVSAYNEAAAFLALFLLAIGLRRRLFSVSLPATVWVVLSATSIPILQYSFGLLPYLGDLTVAVLYLAAFALAIAAGKAWALDGPRESAAALSAATVFAAVVSGFLALLQVLSVDASLWVAAVPPGGRPIGNVGHWNLLANLIGCGAVGLLLLFEQRRVDALASIAMLGVLLLGIGLSQSRTALLFGPIIFLGGLIARRRGIALRTPLPFIAAATLFYWSLCAAAPALQSALLLQAPLSVQEIGVSTPRWQMWRMLLDASTQSPWLGYGWLQVGAAELQVVNQHAPIHEMWLHAHNIFIELIVWCGYPLGLLLGGSLVWWFLSRAGKVRTLESLVGMLMLGVLAAHSLLEFPYQYAYFLLPAGLWVGHIEAAIGSRGWLSPKWVALPLALSLGLAMGIAAGYPAVEEDYRLVRFQNLRIGPASTVDSTPDTPFLSALTGFLHFSRTQATGDMSARALERMAASAKRYPYPASLARWGRALALNGRMAEARERFISIRQMFGPALYRTFRNDLRMRAEGGEGIELAALADSLPD